MHPLHLRSIDINAPVAKEPGRLAPSVARAERSAIPITHIQTEPGISVRLSVHPPMTNVRWLDDAQLLQQLADSGKAGGLVYVDNTPMLITSDELTLH